MLESEYCPLGPQGKNQRSLRRVRIVSVPSWTTRWGYWSFISPVIYAAHQRKVMLRHFLGMERSSTSTLLCYLLQLLTGMRWIGLAVYPKKLQQGFSRLVDATAKLEHLERLPSRQTLYEQGAGKAQKIACNLSHFLPGEHYQKERYWPHSIYSIHKNHLISSITAINPRSCNHRQSCVFLYSSLSMFFKYCTGRCTPIFVPSEELWPMQFPPQQPKVYFKWKSIFFSKSKSSVSSTWKMSFFFLHKIWGIMVLRHTTQEMTDRWAKQLLRESPPCATQGHSLMNLFQCIAKTIHNKPTMQQTRLSWYIHGYPAYSWHTVSVIMYKMYQRGLVILITETFQRHKGKKLSGLQMY